MPLAVDLRPAESLLSVIELRDVTVEGDEEVPEIAVAAYAYNLHELRERERALSVQGERAYQRLVAHWQPGGPKGTGAGATTGERR